MSMLFIKINFNQRYSLLFPRNKVTMVLKLALLASHTAETLIENLRKTSECDVNPTLVVDRGRVSEFDILSVKWSRRL